MTFNSNPTSKSAAREPMRNTDDKFTFRASDEHARDKQLFEIAMQLMPTYGKSWNDQYPLTLKRQTLSRVIYFNELYGKILDVPGVICEFGVYWGASLSILLNLRGMYEPYNFSRKVIGFDTFEGFSKIDKKDGELPSLGDFATLDNYEVLLDKVLNLQESFSPLSHIKKYELVKGDAALTFKAWLEENPHAIISMAHFDMDIYKPTKDVLELLIPRLTKGSLLIFDELNCPFWPGETSAVQEVLGLNNISLKRHPHQPFCSWAVFGR